MDQFMREKKIKEKNVNCNIVCTYKNRNKGNEKARSGKGRSCLSYTSYHAWSKPLFYCMSGLSVSIRGIIIFCDIGVVKNKTERVMGDIKKRKDGGQYLPTTYMDRMLTE